MVQYYDQHLVSQGMIQWATITATLNYNVVGSWTIVMPYSQSIWNMMMAGDFIIDVNWRNLFHFGGKCETPAFSNSIPGANATGAVSSGVAGAFITLSGADYLAMIANRICYPDPTKIWTQQLAADQDVVANVPLESAIKYYVNRNIGSAPVTIAGSPPFTCNPAIASRQHPLLDIATDQGRGPIVNYSVKFGSNGSLNLLDVIRLLIGQAYPTQVPGQGMGVNVKLNGSRLLFDVYIPQNKSNVSFSEDMGNLTSIFFSLTDPTVTNALVQGAATLIDPNTGKPSGKNPFFEQPGNNVTSWNRIETFVDSTSETDYNNLVATGGNTLTSGGMGPTLTTTVTDTPYTIYGRDYSLGDIVSVEVQEGNVYTDIVSSVTLTADPSQTPILNVVPVIGNSTDPSATNPTINKQIIAKIKNMEKRLSAKGL